MKKLNIKAMSEAIEKIMSSLGYDVLKAVNVNKFQSAVDDFMPGTMFEVEKQTLLQCVRIGVGDKFIQAISKTEEEQKRIITNVYKTLTEDYAFREDRANCIIGAFAQALKMSPQVYNIGRVITEAVQPIIIKETINTNSSINSSSANSTTNISKKTNVQNNHISISNAGNSKTANQPTPAVHTNENTLGVSNRCLNDCEFNDSPDFYILWALLLFAGYIFDYDEWPTISVILGVVNIFTTTMYSINLWSEKGDGTFVVLILKIISVITVWFAAYHFGLGKFLTYMWG